MRFTTRNASYYLPYFAPEGGGSGAGGNAPGAGNTPGAGGNAPGAGGPWYVGAGAAQEHHEWLGAKQFQDVNALLTSHRSLEGIVGRNRLAVPKDANDVDAYNAIYSTLGRPAAHADYKPADGSKIEGSALEWLKPVAHKLGISQGQYAGLISAYEAEGTRIRETAETERRNQESAQIEALKKEWGSNLDANEDIAARAFRSLKIGEEQVNAIEDAIGYAATMKLFHAIGAGMGEARLLQSDVRPGETGGTLESEQAKLTALFDDKEFMKTYNHHDPRVRKPAIDRVEAIQKRISELKQGGSRR